jgi:hypothetical protein
MSPFFSEVPTDAIEVVHVETDVHTPLAQSAAEFVSLAVSPEPQPLANSAVAARMAIEISRDVTGLDA